MERVCLSTADVARLFNVTETTVKRWSDEGALRCQKTLGGHRKFPIRDVVEFAEKNNLEPLGVLEMPPGDQHCTPQLRLAVMERDFPLLVNAFVDRALAPDRPDLSQFLSYLYEHKIPLWQIFDHLIRPAMELIGERWRKGNIGMALEHRATCETLDALSRLQARIRTRPYNGKTALLACLGDERHEIGLRCASNLIESEGWRTLYLGATIPPESVMIALRDIRPALLCCSLTWSANARSLAPQLATLARVAREQGVSTLAGGRALEAHTAGMERFDHVVSSTRELLSLVSQRDVEVFPSVGISGK